MAHYTTNVAEGWTISSWHRARCLVVAGAVAVSATEAFVNAILEMRLLAPRRACLLLNDSDVIAKGAILLIKVDQHSPLHIFFKWLDLADSTRKETSVEQEIRLVGRPAHLVARRYVETLIIFSLFDFFKEATIWKFAKDVQTVVGSQA